MYARMEHGQIEMRIDTADLQVDLSQKITITEGQKQC
jgi:hypothetical protein